MDAKRLVTGSVVGGIVLFVLGYLFWEMLFAGFFEANAGSATGVSKDPQLMWAVALGTLSYAALLTLAIGSRGSTAIADGVKAGAVVGFLMWFGVDMILYGILNLSTLTGAIADSLLELVRGGVAGAVIAAVLGKMTG